MLGVSTAQWRKVDLQAQLQMTRLDAEGADRCCFGTEQSIFAAPHTPNFRLLSFQESSSINARADLRSAVANPSVKRS
jgi:hypothetical protein